MGYIYDSKRVQKGRSTKYCECCGNTISKGKSSITVTYYQDEFTNFSVCSNKCLEDITKRVEQGGSPWEDGNEEDEEDNE